MNAENQAVISELVISVRKLVHAVYLDSKQMSKRYGLTGPQSAVLRILGSNGSMSSADLSRRLYVTPANVTGIIDRLEKKGCVERIRKENDRRVALITLTESGRQLSQSIPDPIENKFISELADLEPQHVQILAMAMQQVTALVGTEDIAAAPLELNSDQLNKMIRPES